MSLIEENRNALLAAAAVPRKASPRGKGTLHQLSPKEVERAQTTKATVEGPQGARVLTPGERMREDERRVAGPGRYRDGGGLLLDVKPNGRGYWTYQYMLRGKSHFMGLGSARDVSLKRARQEAAKHREAKACGECPLTERKEETKASIATTTTFWQVAEKWLANNRGITRTTRAERESEMTRFIGPVLGSMPISTIEQQHVIAMLEKGGEASLWQAKNPTALKLLRHCRNVFDFAMVRGLCPRRENPAGFRPQDVQLASEHEEKERASMDYKAMPEFMARLRAEDSIEARALEFTILTAARINMVTLMTWSEVDLPGAVWTAPAEHMKLKVKLKKKKDNAHRCPLSDRALELLRGLPRGAPDDLIFASGKFQRKVLNFLRKTMGEDKATIHGFRTAFKLWGEELGDYSNEDTALALAHFVGTPIERKYKRGAKDPKRFDKRVPLMQAWANYCAITEAGSNIVRLKAA